MHIYWFMKPELSDPEYLPDTWWTRFTLSTMMLISEPAFLVTLFWKVLSNHAFKKQNELTHFLYSTFIKSFYFKNYTLNKFPLFIFIIPVIIQYNFNLRMFFMQTPNELDPQPYSHFLLFRTDSSKMKVSLKLISGKLLVR